MKKFPFVFTYDRLMAVLRVIECYTNAMSDVKDNFTQLACVILVRLQLKLRARLAFRFDRKSYSFTFEEGIAVVICWNELSRTGWDNYTLAIMSDINMKINSALV